MPKKDIVPVHR